MRMQMRRARFQHPPRSDRRKIASSRINPGCEKAMARIRLIRKLSSVRMKKSMRPGPAALKNAETWAVPLLAVHVVRCRALQTSLHRAFERRG